MYTKTALEINDLGVCYDVNRIFNGLTLKLSPGEKVTLTGPSGSGKSTVLRCILGFVTPENGTIKVFGETLNGYTVWNIRHRLAYVAQEPDLGNGTVREIIEKPFAYRANSDLRSNLDRMGELMERFNLPQAILEKQMSYLSGGEKQRVALVSAILLDRSIILMDEASSALDKNNKQAVADYFMNAKGTAVLSVSHDVEWQSFSDRVFDMGELDIISGGQE